jgi:uracil-DNA glycosylase family 4
MADTKQRKLDAIRQDILDNNVTPELAKTANQLVFGTGNPDAEIVFVGEAPGKNEDLKGEPFVGAAGKFLDEMLASVSLNRDDIYITNIVKYRPPNNRDPLPEEKKAFLPYLQAQLEVIQPKVLVTLGRHSTNSFLPDLQISKEHGNPKKVKLAFHDNRTDPTQVLEIVILPLFHPAAALYNGGLRQTLLDDFLQIPTLLKKISHTN